MKGYIYIISQVDGIPANRKSYYKVGVSKDPDKRRDELQTGNPLLLVVEEKKEVENMHRAEETVHDELEYSDFVLGGTEWFYCTLNRALKAMENV